MTPPVEQKSINLLTLAPGTRLELADGSVVEVVENPGDGSWVYCHYLSSPDPALPGDAVEHPVFAGDILAILPQP